MPKPKFDLLREAAAIIDGIPERHVYLNIVMFQSAAVEKPKELPKECGSVGCFIGWLGQHPKFQRLGLRTNEKNDVFFKGRRVSYDVAANRLFDISYADAGRLFGPAGAPSEDHKEVLRRRIRSFLQDHGEPVNPNY